MPEREYGKMTHLELCDAIWAHENGVAHPVAGEFYKHEWHHDYLHDAVAIWAALCDMWPVEVYINGSLGTRVVQWSDPIIKVNDLDPGRALWIAWCQRMDRRNAGRASDAAGKG